MKFWHYALASTALTAGLVAIKAAQYPNVYVSVYALTVSLPNLLIICNFAAMVGFLLGGALVSIFLGKLREAERESLTSSIVFFLFELMITTSSMTQIQYSASLITCGYPVVFLMLLHLVARERVKVFFRSITPPSVLTQLRFVGFVLFLAASDYFLVRYTYDQFLIGHYTMLFYSLRILSILEVLLLTISTFLIDKYESHYLEANDEDHWEAKAVFVFCSKFAGNMLTFTGVCGLLYLFPGFFSPMYASLLTCLYKIFTLVRQFFAARRAQNELDDHVIDATLSDLQRDSTCVVCRDEMEIGAHSARLAPKRLGCGHVIHKGCLKLWMGRSQDCPTCRQPVKSRQRNFYASTQVPVNQPMVAERADAAEEAWRPQLGRDVDQDIPDPAVAPRTDALPILQQADAESGADEYFREAPPQAEGTADALVEPQQTSQSQPVVLDMREWTSYPIQRENDVRKIKIGEDWYEMTEC